MHLAAAFHEITQLQIIGVLCHRHWQMFYDAQKQAAVIAHYETYHCNNWPLIQIVAQ